LRDFWRRWHISLSNFIRDYLYIPLGGSRNGPVVYVFATLVAMAICGLWHGAGWTYVAWGSWHGVGLIVCHAWQKLARPMPALAGWAITMLFVLVGWVLFRAADFSTATAILAAMAGADGITGGLRNAPLLGVAAAVSALLPSAYEIMERRPILNPAVATAFAVLAAFCVLEVGRGPPLSFIYFRF